MSGEEEVAVSRRKRQRTAEGASSASPPDGGGADVPSTPAQKVFLRGHYRKLERGLAHTPWRVGETSAEDKSVEAELLSVPNRYFGVDVRHAAPGKLISAGREDRDVRMLGPGRPFVLEIDGANEHLNFGPQDCLAMQKAMNGSVGSNHEEGEQDEEEGGGGARRTSPAVLDGKGGYHPMTGVEVLNLAPGSRDDVQALAAAAASKNKTYGAVVWCSQPLSSSLLAEVLDGASFPLTVTQSTPLRVLHRRSALFREKVIKRMRSTWINGNYFILEIEASAGTYIKEFVHGDRGRTAPSVTSILRESLLRKRGVGRGGSEGGGGGGGGEGAGGASEGGGEGEGGGSRKNLRDNAPEGRPPPLYCDCMQLDVLRVDCVGLW